MPKKNMTTPKGYAVWPWLNEPDSRWDKPEYKVSLKMTNEDGAELLEKLQEFYKSGYMEEAKKQGKQRLKKAPMPWSEVEDDQGNLTGEIQFKFKNRASYEYEGKVVENRVVLKDRHGQIVESRIGSGSLIRVGFEPYVWHVASMGVGMTLRVKAVQVLELVEYNGGGGDDFDFEFEPTSASDTGAEDPFGF